MFYHHLEHFVFIWYIFPVLISCTYLERFGNPGCKRFISDERTYVICRIAVKTEYVGRYICRQWLGLSEGMLKSIINNKKVKI
jgi:hypothetical protein